MMGGNPRWMYCASGGHRELHDFTPLLAEFLAAAVSESREQRAVERFSRSARAARASEREPAFVCRVREVGR